MSWNLIYYGAFNDNVNSDRIDIKFYQENFGGVAEQLLLDAKPLVITYPSHEFDSQIFGCGAQINIINTSNDFYKYDSLFSIPERSNYVEVIKTIVAEDTSVYLFQGYILPDMYSSKLSKNIAITIPAIDRLSTLDRFAPAILIDTSSWRSDEYINANDLLLTCLMDADVTDKILINNTLENKNYKRDASSCVFDNVFFQTDNFHDDENLENDKTCVEKILKSFYSRIFYYNGRWHIERISDMGDINKQYTYYQPSTETTSLNMTNNRIELSCGNHEIISGSPELYYNPGYSKIIVKLNYKQPESLIENYFYDIQPLDPCTASNGNMPMPGFREWMVSSQSLTNYQGTWNGFTTYPDTSLWLFPTEWNPDFEKGATFFYLSGYFSQAMQEWADDQVLTTMFQFPPLSSSNDQLIVKVNYKVAIDTYQSGETNSAYKTRFALRGVDKNGKDWWIAKAHYGDTSTYWKDTPYTFDTSILRSVLMADNVGKAYMLWEIEEDVNISSPIMTDVSLCVGKKRRTNMITINDSVYFYNTLFNKWETYTYEVPTDPEYIGQLYLDVYMFELTRPSGGGWQANYNPYIAYFGDFDVDIETKVPTTYLEASLGYYYDTIERSLDIFDTSTILFTNGLYNVDASLVLRSIDAWRDSSADNYISIQEKYIEDIAQMVSTPKYKFTVDVRSRDSSVWGLHNIFTHNVLKYPDSSLMEFMCNGLQYNVKENTYRLDLLEYINDNNWRVGPTSYYFTVDTNAMTFTYNNGTTDRIINLNTNVPSWTITPTETWIDTSISGEGPLWYCSVDLSTNTGLRRDGSILFIPNDSSLSTHTVSIRQDPSSMDYIEFDLNGYINISSPIAVDISIECYAAAYACNYGSPYSADSAISYKGTEIASASASPTAGNCEDSTDTQNVADFGVKDASNCRITFDGTDYYAWSDGEQMSNGSAKITKAIISGTTTDVSLHYNMIIWDTDHIPYLWHEE